MELKVESQAILDYKENISSLPYRKPWQIHPQIFSYKFPL